MYIIRIKWAMFVQIFHSTKRQKWGRGGKWDENVCRWTAINETPVELPSSCLMVCLYVCAGVCVLCVCVWQQAVAIELSKLNNLLSTWKHIKSDGQQKISAEMSHGSEPKTESIHYGIRCSTIHPSVHPSSCAFVHSSKRMSYESSNKQKKRSPNEAVVWGTNLPINFPERIVFHESWSLI